MKNGVFDWSRQEIPNSEIQKRIETLQDKMDEKNLDALIVFGDVNEAGAVSYFSNFAPYYFSTALVLLQTGKGLMTTAMAQRSKPWIQSTSLIQDIRFQGNYGKGCSDVLKEIGLKHNRVGIVELDLFPYTAFVDLKKEFPQVEFIDETKMVNELRFQRSPIEMNLIRRAGQIAYESLESVVRNWNFQKECEVSAEIERQARYRRCEDVFVHVASHADGLRWLHLPKEQKIEKEILVEVMVQYKNYWADIGRTVIPTKADSSLLNLKGRTEEIYFKTIRNLKPGVKLSDIFDKIKKEENKNTKIFSSIGFGLYVESMQRASISEKESKKYNNLELKENMEVIFQFGVMDTTNFNKFLIQDTFLIVKNVAQNLTETPCELT